MILLGGLTCLREQNEKREFQEMMEPFLKQKKIWEEYQTELPQIMEQLRLGNRKDTIESLEKWVVALRACKFIPTMTFPSQGETVLGILYEENEPSAILCPRSQELYDYLHSAYPDYPFDMNEIQFDNNGTWDIRLSQDKILRKKSQTPIEN